MEINYFLIQYYNEKGKRSGLQLYHPYHKNLTSVACRSCWYKKSRKWPQDHYFSQKVLFYPFLTQCYNRKGKKDLDFSYTTHITRTSRVWQAIWGADIYSTKKSENGLRIIIFHKKYSGFPTYFLNSYSLNFRQEAFHHVLHSHTILLY